MEYLENGKWVQYKMVAKLKFWFGQDHKDLFNSEKYIVEETPDGFVYIYTKA